MSADGEPKIQRKRTHVGLLIGVVAVGSATLALVMTRDDEPGWSRRDVVSGTMVKGSLRFQRDPCEYRFYLTNGDATVTVRYTGCAVPDSFRDAPGEDLRLMAEGKLDPAGHFEARQIMVYLPREQEMPERR